MGNLAREGGAPVEGLTYEEFAARVESPQEAWELLATLDRVPPAWIDDPARRFSCPKARFPGRVGPAATCVQCGGKGLLPHPAAIRQAWDFAQARDHVVRAEALVTESYQTLRDFGFDAELSPTVVWEPSRQRPREDLFILRAYEERSVELSGIPRRALWLLRWDGFLFVQDRTPPIAAPFRDPLSRRVAALWELATQGCALYPYSFRRGEARLQWMTLSTS